MRVLHVTPYFAPAHVYGGPPRSIFGLCRALIDAGVDARVVTTTANGAGELGAAAEGTIYAGVPVRYCPRRFPRFAWNAGGVRDAIADELSRTDLVHLHALWHAPGWIAAAAARSAGIPYVLAPRGMLQPAAVARHRWRKRVASRLFQDGDLRGASLLHATSPEEADALARAAYGPRVTVVPNGVPLASGSHRREAGAPTILYLGRLDPIKRLDLLAAAVGLLRTRDVTVVVAGPDERKHRDAVAPLFERTGARVLWPGEVDDAAKATLLAAACVLVVCSDSESFGMSVIEAMAAGVPVVVTRTCPWREVEEERAGCWVEQKPQAIAMAIDRILGDPGGALEMGRRGRALVARRYTWDAVAAAMIAEYRAVLAQGAA